MEFSTNQIRYQQTGKFSKLITDYLDNAQGLRQFYEFPVNKEGIKAAIEKRKQYPVDRELLTSFLTRAYSELPASTEVNANIVKLRQDNTFTIVTAHQPNIFTGHLYFVYKILHVVKLAANLTSQFPEYNFVPVFYMGSEDADLEELGHIYLNGEKIEWATRQKGAVGRMKTDGLDSLILRLEGELKTLPFGEEILQLLKDCYRKGLNIQQATFQLVHSLFSRYGLITIVPDDKALKATMTKIFEDDLINQTASGIVSKTIDELGEHYKVQAQPREINLFYLKDDIRERIVKNGEQWRVTGTDIAFTRDEILSELKDHPDRFSPNVILRGLFQEILLPDIAFVGGGGETAYWLELKSLFAHYGVFFPMLILRNSFLIVESRWQEKINKLGLNIARLFSPETELLKEIVNKRSSHTLDLATEISAIARTYEAVKENVALIDTTLIKHVDNLQAKAEKRLRDLENKMMRAEKRRFQDESRQLQQLKERLFPGNGLQERTENLLPYYSNYGAAFMDLIYRHSLGLEQEFVVLTQVE